MTIDQQLHVNVAEVGNPDKDDPESDISVNVYQTRGGYYVNGRVYGTLDEAEQAACAEWSRLNA